MARVRLDIDDGANRLTVKAMLEADGHDVCPDGPDVAITDDIRRARALAPELPTLVLAAAGEVPAAVEAMRHGVRGYIFVPLQPGEAGMMATWAAAAGRDAGQAGFAARTLREVERDHIRATLRHCGYSRTEAARLLGIGRNTLWRRLRDAEDEEGDSGH